MIKTTTGLVVSALSICTMVVKEYFSPVTAINAGVAVIGLKKGNVPPNFEFTTLTGDKVKLSDFKGKKLILNFWATWCPPCKEEMSHLEKYYKKNKNSANVEIIAVNMTNQDKPERVKEFVDAYELTFPILFDNNGELITAYQILTLPTTYLINTDGTIAHQILGPLEEKRLEELVNNLE